MLRSFPALRIATFLVFAGTFCTALVYQVMGQSIDTSPLPPCPETPNCVHQVHAFDELPSTLADATETALHSLSPLSFERGVIDTHAMHAVYRAGFFKDDVEIAIEVDEAGGSRLYIRSASRVGRYDFGVNKRRIRRILKALKRVLQKEASSP